MGTHGGHNANTDRANPERDFKSGVTVKSMTVALIIIVLALIANRHQVAGRGPGIPATEIVPSMLPMLFLIVCTSI